MGGRLKHYAAEWQEITSDPWVLEVISQGLALTFKGKLPSLSVDPKPVRLPGNPQKRQALLDAVQELQEKQAVERCHVVEPAFFAHLFVVPKKSGGWRPVIDLSLLNKFLAVPHFKMETVQSIRAQLQQGEYVVLLDLQDAYFHIPIRQKFQKFLKFCLMGIVYKFLALCFGLATAPRVFTMVMRSVVKFVRKLGMMLHAYLDDWLLRNRSPEVLHAQLRKLLVSEEELQGSVSGHDVRRMSTSCSFAAGTRLQDILEAAEWKQTTTFTCHYLKDIEPQPDGMYRLGAVLAGSRRNV